MQITYSIDLKGNVTADVTGGDGTNCKQATKPYEDALGDVDDRKMKPEASPLRQLGTTNQAQRINL